MQVSNQERKTRRPPYSADIDFWINAAASALGERSALAGTVAVLEHGGQFTGVPETDLYSDRQVGWVAGEGLVAKARRLERIWRLLSIETQRVLCAYYSRAWVLSLDRGSTIESRVGERVAGVALVVMSPEDVAKMVSGCANSGSRTLPVFTKARRVALERAHEAHQAWRVMVELTREDAA